MSLEVRSEGWSHQDHSGVLVLQTLQYVLCLGGNYAMSVCLAQYTMLLDMQCLSQYTLENITTYMSGCKDCINQDIVVKFTYLCTDKAC